MAIADAEGFNAPEGNTGPTGPAGPAEITVSVDPASGDSTVTAWGLPPDTPTFLVVGDEIVRIVQTDAKGHFRILKIGMDREDHILVQAKGYATSAIMAKPGKGADVPKLKKAEKHDIDVVIDRIKVQAGSHGEPPGASRQPPEGASPV